ncbi:hypothetical protein F6R98_00245 [Candidatus Methylospira mobilis]|uniref:Cobalamin ABC transporter n=1 Tax=Candidatus Methylospira mobilis TaxID=1808979 RepID=A0A5Q0BDM3_9GAMM|nr:hypothetical protein [Candidatus Methylospira mobilis]QFY41232.1 hypothetical protein F6R98_00245 [Candidatus Methylospira mobilis]WNV05548.1 hypothetical protein RP726_03805 [Candidatus Methylospira mobilis]
MNITLASSIRPGAVALMALMAATRFHHVGSAFSLPDASLAVFFLAGLWLGGRYLFIALLLEAGLIDYLAITHNGVSDFCISQAYVFLIPTYAAMWIGGQWCAKFPVLSAASAMQQFAALVMAASIAFLISNGSFYLLSGRYTDLSWGRYFAQAAEYYPSYVGYTLCYTVAIFSIVKLFMALPDMRNKYAAIDKRG